MFKACEPFIRLWVRIKLSENSARKSGNLLYNIQHCGGGDHSPIVLETW